MDKPTFDMLESKGPAKVREEIGRGGHGQPDSPMRNAVEDWLRSKQSVADAESSAKRDAREEETLSIAKEANEIACSNSRRALRAEIIAAIAAIAAIVAAYAAIKGIQ